MKVADFLLGAVLGVCAVGGIFFLIRNDDSEKILKEQYYCDDRSAQGFVWGYVAYKYAADDVRVCRSVVAENLAEIMFVYWLQTRHFGMRKFPITEKIYGMIFELANEEQGELWRALNDPFCVSLYGIDGYAYCEDGYISNLIKNTSDYEENVRSFLEFLRDAPVDQNFYRGLFGEE